MENLIINRQRKEYIDYLRGLATFAVIVLHVSVHNFGSVNINTLEWKIFNIYDSMTRWAVPVFLMISGALFLDMERSIQNMFKKNVLRLFIAYIFWSAIYAIRSIIQLDIDIKSAIVLILEGHYHMWFLPMLIGIYMFVPILRKVVAENVLLVYFLKISIVSIFLVRYPLVFLKLFWQEATNAILVFLDTTKFPFTMGYVFWFVLGYYLSITEICDKKRRKIYILGILGMLMTVFLTDWASIYTHTMVTFYGDTTLNVLLMTVAVFVFIKYNVNRFENSIIGIIVRKISQYSFGIYLVHALILEELDNIFSINTLAFNPLISVPVISIIVLMISLIISAILNHIPFLKKYVV